MKIYLTVAGDSSVGIPDATAEIDLPYQSIEEVIQWRAETDRDNIRKEIANFFGDYIFGDKCHVIFEDEVEDDSPTCCPDWDAVP